MTMLQRVLCIAKTFLIQKYFFLIIWKLFLTPETWMPCWQAATQGKPKIFCPWSGKGTWFAELLEKKKSASGSILAKRNLAKQYFSFAEGLCMPIEIVTSVEEGQSTGIQCRFMAALLSQGKGLQRELMQPAGWMRNGVTIVEEIKKLSSAPILP